MEARKRSISRYSRYVDAPAETVFPLLCPVREHEWIEGWTGELVYADSGVAELDGVFTASPFERIGRETWTCSRYEPPYRIDYIRMSPATVIRLELTLAPAGRGSKVTALLVATATNAAGDAILSEFDTAACERGFKPCFLMLAHYLTNGTMLPRSEAHRMAEAG